jgi:hypothetical protein
LDYPQKKFTIDFDPGKVKVEQLLETVTKAGYRPSREGAVTATASQAGVKVEAATGEASLGAGKQGSVRVVLAADKGHEASELVVEAAAEGPLEPQAKVEAKAGEKQLVVPVTVKEGAAKGVHQLTLTIKWKHAAGKETQAKSLRLQVPVYVE